MQHPVLAGSEKIQYPKFPTAPSHVVTLQAGGRKNSSGFWKSQRKIKGSTREKNCAGSISPSPHDDSTSYACPHLLLINIQVLPARYSDAVLLSQRLVFGFIALYLQFTVHEGELHICSPPSTKVNFLDRQSWKRS
jgi:hypothetical protein